VKARILAIDSDEHRAVQLLLPWHASGTLPVADAARVQAHLLQCERCRADLAAQGRLRDALRREAQPAPLPDLAHGWALLRDAVAPADDGAEAEVRETSRPAPPRRRATGGPSGAAADAPRPARWLPYALGLQGVFALALMVVIAIGWHDAAQRGEPFRALGSGAPAEAANALIVFRPDASEAQIRHALRSSGARLVGGPTVTDAYLLQVAAPIGPALALLRSAPAVARVESLDGEVRR